MNTTDDICSKVPGVVALAAIITMTAGAHAILGAFLSYGFTVEGMSQLVYGVFVITLGYQLLFLEKWSYWGFLVVAALGSLNIITDLLLIVVGMYPDDGVLLIQIVQLVILIIFLIAFLSSSVRSAFGVK